MLLRKIFGVSLCLLLKIVTITCEDGISLTFAIDDTLSMSDDIAQVAIGAESIVHLVLSKKARDVKDFVLVTFHDDWPDNPNLIPYYDHTDAVILRKNTSSPNEFLEKLRGLRARHNGINVYCPELALSGLQMALENSRPKSYIYVFTDASAKDFHKFERIKKLCQEKQSQVIIVYSLTEPRNCHKPYGPMYEVYYDIAAACSGQFIVVNKNDVKSPLETAKTLLQGKQSIFIWKIVPRSSTYVPVPFTIDEKAEYATVSAAGISLNLKITSTDNMMGPTPTYEIKAWNDNYKVVTLVNKKPGTYYAWVKGDSKISVVVFGRTDFTFDYGFSVFRPKSLSDTSKQPIAGIKQHLTINVTDPDHSVDIQAAHILDIKNNDQILYNLPLKNVGNNIYITDAFISPNDTFKIEVAGETIMTHKYITRLSKNVNVQHVDLTPESIPQINIKEGSSIDVDYGSDVLLTCEVTAHPAPEIVWYTSSGDLFIPKSSLVKDTTYISYLELRNMKQNKTCTCQARNTKGTGSDRQIKVNLRPVYTITSMPKEFNVKFGEDVTIPCNIRSSQPITIKWYNAGKEITYDSNYVISKDRSELTLKSINIAMQGSYACEATLNTDPTVKETLNTEVKIPGLVRPKIQSSNRNVHVMKGEKIELDCKTVQGYPKPVTKWFKKSGAFNIPLTNVNSEVLTMAVSSLENAGQYRCEAINPMGTDTASFEVIISSRPDITVADPKRTVSYDSTVVLDCNVEAYPKPSIVWKDIRGSVMQSKEIQISQYQYVKQLELQNVRKNHTYICEADNNVGSTNKYVVGVTVLSPFEVKNHIHGNIEVYYEGSQNLDCDIKSVIKMKIQWYIQKDDNSRRSIISSSKQYAVSNDGRQLTINSMDKDMEGQYTCEASLLSIPEEKIVYSAEVTVTGLSGAKIINPEKFIVQKNLTALCRVQGTPAPVISWLFKQKTSDVFKKMSGSGEILNIPELKLTDTGVYRCVAKNIVGEDKYDFDIVVKERPLISNKNMFYYGVDGDLVLKVPCDVTGFPDPIITWKRKGLTLKMDTKFTTKETTLYIHNPVQSDSNEYTCEATNELGSDTMTAHVEIDDDLQGNNNLTNDIHDKFAQEDKPIDIVCNLNTSENESVRWYKDGVLTKQTGRTYKIERVSYEDEGNYTCRTNTDEGSNSLSYTVHVGYAPRFQDDSSPVSVTWKDNSQKLGCYADSEPPAEYMWLLNGQIIRTRKDEHELHITNWGKYTCKASNVHDHIEKTFEVISKGCYISKYINTTNQPLAFEISGQRTPTWPKSLTTSDLKLKKDEDIKLFCPGNQIDKHTNGFKIAPSKNTIIAKCITEDKFTVAGETYGYTDLQCTSKVEPAIKRTGEQCLGQNSESIRVGFEVNGFLDAYTVCYDKKLSMPLYASAPTSVLRTENVADPANFEWSTTSELHGQASAYWIPKGSCYTKDQLVNVLDVAFGPAQSATYKVNLNSVSVWNPQCDHSNRISWQNLLEQISETSLSYTEWSSWTGASEYGHVDGFGLRPKYLWKVITYEGKTAVIVFVNYKNADATRDVRCSTACNPALSLETDQFLYCCSLQEFTEKFGVPKQIFQTV